MIINPRAVFTKVGDEENGWFNIQFSSYPERQGEASMFDMLGNSFGRWKNSVLMKFSRFTRCSFYQNDGWRGLDFSQAQFYPWVNIWTRQRRVVLRGRLKFRMRVLETELGLLITLRTVIFGLSSVRSCKKPVPPPRSVGIPHLNETTLSKTQTSGTDNSELLLDRKASRSIPTQSRYSICSRFNYAGSKEWISRITGKTELPALGTSRPTPDRPDRLLELFACVCYVRLHYGARLQIPRPTSLFTR